MKMEINRNKNLLLATEKAKAISVSFVSRLSAINTILFKKYVESGDFV